MNDYVRATHKSNGELAVIKLVSDGKMNPSLQDFDIVTDGEIHTLKYHVSVVILYLIQIFPTNVNTATSNRLSLVYLNTDNLAQEEMYQKIVLLC